jgi:hypothetical protein
MLLKEPVRPIDPIKPSIPKPYSYVPESETIKDPIRFRINLFMLAQITVTKVDDQGAIHFTRNEADYVCYRNEDGRVAVLPTAVHAYVQQLQSSLGSLYTVSVSVLYPKCTDLARCVGVPPQYRISINFSDRVNTIPQQGALVSMSFIVDSQADYTGGLAGVEYMGFEGKVDAELLYAGLSQLSDKPIDLFRRIRISQADETGIYFSLLRKPPTSYRIYRNAEGEVVLKPIVHSKIPPEVQDYIDQLKEQLGDGFDIKVSVHYSRVLISPPQVDGWTITITDSKQYVAQPASGLKEISVFLSEEGVQQNVENVIYYTASGELRVDCQLLFEAMGVCVEGQACRRTPYSDIEKLVKMTQIVVMRAEDDVIFFTNTLDGKNYKTYREADGTVRVIPEKGLEAYQQAIELLNDATSGAAPDLNKIREAVDLAIELMTQLGANYEDKVKILQIAYARLGQLPLDDYRAELAKLFVRAIADYLANPNGVFLETAVYDYQDFAIRLAETDGLSTVDMAETRGPAPQNLPIHRVIQDSEETITIDYVYNASGQLIYTNVHIHIEGHWFTEDYDAIYRQYADSDVGKAALRADALAQGFSQEKIDNIYLNPSSPSYLKLGFQGEEWMSDPEQLQKYIQDHNLLEGEALAQFNTAIADIGSNLLVHQYEPNGTGEVWTWVSASDSNKKYQLVREMVKILQPDGTFQTVEKWNFSTTQWVGNAEQLHQYVQSRLESGQLAQFNTATADIGSNPLVHQYLPDGSGEVWAWVSASDSNKKYTLSREVVNGIEKFTFSTQIRIIYIPYIPEGAGTFPATLQYYNANGDLLREVNMSSPTQVDVVREYAPGGDPAEKPAKVIVFAQGAENPFSEIFYNDVGVSVREVKYQYLANDVVVKIVTDYAAGQTKAFIGDVEVIGNKCSIDTCTVSVNPGSSEIVFTLNQGSGAQRLYHYRIPSGVNSQVDDYSAGGVLSKTKIMDEAGRLVREDYYNPGYFAAFLPSGIPVEPNKVYIQVHYDPATGAALRLEGYDEQGRILRNFIYDEGGSPSVAKFIERQFFFPNLGAQTISITYDRANNASQLLYNGQLISGIPDAAVNEDGRSGYDYDMPLSATEFNFYRIFGLAQGSNDEIYTIDIGTGKLIRSHQIIQEENTQGTIDTTYYLGTDQKQSVRMDIVVTLPPGGGIPIPITITINTLEEYNLNGIVIHKVSYDEVDQIVTEETYDDQGQLIERKATMSRDETAQAAREMFSGDYLAMVIAAIDSAPEGTIFYEVTDAQGNVTYQWGDASMTKVEVTQGETRQAAQATLTGDQLTDAIVAIDNAPEGTKFYKVTSTEGNVNYQWGSASIVEITRNETRQAAQEILSGDQLTAALAAIDSAPEGTEFYKVTDAEGNVSYQWPNTASAVQPFTINVALYPEGEANTTVQVYEDGHATMTVDGEALEGQFNPESKTIRFSYEDEFLAQWFGSYIVSLAPKQGSSANDYYVESIESKEVYPDMREGWISESHYNEAGAIDPNRYYEAQIITSGSGQGVKYGSDAPVLLEGNPQGESILSAFLGGENILLMPLIKDLLGVTD